MPYAFVNDTQNSVDGVSAVNISAPAASIGASNVLVVAATYTNATAQTTTITDNLGTNVYVPMATVYIAANQVGVAFFYALNSTAGNTTITANFAASCTFRGIYAGQYSGITNLLTSTGQENESAGIGANANTSGNAPVAQVPAMAWGFCAPVHNFNVTPTSGTSPLVYSGRTPSWNLGGASPFALAEDARVITTGNVAATFGVNEASGRYVFLAVFQEIIPQQLGATGIFVTP